jgi:hypothetical protein
MLKISVALVLCVHICVSAEFERAGPEHFHLAFASLLADCCASHLPTHPPHTCLSTARPPYTRPSTQPVHPSPPSFQAERQGVLRRVFWAVRPCIARVAATLTSSRLLQNIKNRLAWISSNDSFGLSRYVADSYRVSSLLTKISPPVAIRLCIVRVAASLPSSRLPQNITKPSGLTAGGLL